MRTSGFPHRAFLLVAVVSGLTVASSAEAGLTGLLGSYYQYKGGYLEDFTFSDPGYEFGFQRIDPDIAFGYSQEHYATNNGNGWGFDWEPFGQGAGAFGVHWEGWLTVPEGDPLYLATHADDGSYVFINDEKFISNGGQHYPTFGWSDQALTAGRYKIDVFLFCNDLTPPIEKSGIDLWWSPEQEIIKPSAWVPGDALEPVPEPATLTLMLTGLAGGALMRRRKARERA